MNIGQVSQASGLPSKTIRFYEQLGLVVPARQLSNGYRSYSLDDVERLRFIQRARAVGFGLEECRELLVLYSDPMQRNQGVVQLLATYLQHLEQQLIALEAMRSSIESMMEECIREAGDNSDLPPTGELTGMSFRLVDS